MNAGEFRERVEVLGLKAEGNEWRWEPESRIWAKAERQDKSNLFSSVGMGAKSVKFTVRQRPLTLHNAFRWKGKHCFLTDIKDIGRMYWEVSAALVEPAACRLFRRTDSVDEYKRPVHTETRKMLTFPAILTEKYLGFVQNIPMAQTQTIFVLVTPKEVVLKTADLVEVNDARYAVRICHTLDEYKNEYEIAREEEP